VVDHGRALDDPGVPLTGRRVGPLLRPEDPSLLLGLADEDHPFGGGEAGQVRRHHVVLPLFGREGDEGDLLPGREGLQGPDEGLADRVHQGRGGKRVPAVVAEERDHAPLVLELGDVHVEVHAINALDFQRDVLPENLGDGSWYAHARLRSCGGPAWTT